MSPSPHSNRSDREVADTIARALSGRGTPVRRESAGGHEFILHQQDGDGTETELMWIACDRTVGESHVEKLKQSATSVGASCVCIVTTDDGQLETTPGPDVSHVEASDLSDQFGNETEPPHSDAGGPGSVAETEAEEPSQWDGLTVETDGTQSNSPWAGTTVGWSERPPPSRSPWDQLTLGKNR